MSSNIETTQDLDPQAQNGPAQILAVSAAGLFVFLICYVLLFCLHANFPYIESGVSRITRLKHDIALNGSPFKSSNGLKVMVFGNSKVLSGFIPSQFDRELAARGMAPVESYNFGLPGDDRFVSDFENMVARGNVPDVVLVSIPWPAAPEPSPNLFHFAEHEQKIMDRLFPFRKLPRDFLIMASLADWNPSAFHDQYVNNETILRQMEIDRGYYFIARESHYKNDELPADLRFPTDTPYTKLHRDIPMGPIFDHLMALFAAHKVKCLFIPTYFREGQYAPADAVRSATHQNFGSSPDMDVLGPDYFLYPNRLFSDFNHMNPQGAETYTHDVATLVADWYKQHPPAK